MQSCLSDIILDCKILTETIMIIIFLHNVEYCDFSKHALCWEVCVSENIKQLKQI